jgi:hypothetical protein
VAGESARPGRAGKEHAVSNTGRLGLVGAVIVVAVVLFVVLRSGDSGSDSSSTTSAGAGAIPTIQVKDAKSVGGIQDLSVTKGDPIRFKVDSDTAGDVHLHGYEIEKPVKKGGSVSFDVPSTLDGEFEIELHIGGSETNAVQIGQLTVNP